MTGWLADTATPAHGMLAGSVRRDLDVGVYREAVEDVLAELTCVGGCSDVATAERVLVRRLFEPEFGAVLSAMPPGPDAAIARVLREVRTYRPHARSSAGDLAGMIRIALLAQIDTLWWGHLPTYDFDEDVLVANDLLDLDALRRGDMLLFRYRRQASSLFGRAARSAERLAAPDHTPRTAGLRFACARAELIVLLNQIAAEFAKRAPHGTPRLWVTSLVRSVEHQLHLQRLGYAALLPSAHCVGYAADIEMTWFRRFQADQILQNLLLERQGAGDINVIDEGQAWHVCLHPGSGRALRLIPEHAVGG